MILLIHDKTDDKWPYETLADLVDICPKTRFIISDATKEDSDKYSNQDIELVFVGNDETELHLFGTSNECLGFIKKKDICTCIREYSNVKNTNVSEIKSRFQKYLQK